MTSRFIGLLGCLCADELFQGGVAVDVAELAERQGLQLANALSAEPKFAADFSQGMGLLLADSEAHPNNALFAWIQSF